MTTIVSIFWRPSWEKAFQGRTRSRAMRNLTLFPQSVRPEAHVADLAALRALAQVLGELLRIEGFDRPVLPFDPRDHERFAVGRRHGSEGELFRERKELHAHAAVRTLRNLLEREHQQPS